MAKIQADKEAIPPRRKKLFKPIASILILEIKKQFAGSCELVELSADLECKANGSTPLMVVAPIDNESIVRLLVELGAVSNGD